MQGDTALSEIVDILLGEVPVHIGIDQTEDDGLVAHECLVVTLAVRDGLLVRTTVLNLPEDRADIDILVAYLFNSLDPVVGDVHGHTVVEAVTAILELSCQSWHTRYLLSDRNRIRIHLVDQTVGQRQIADGVVVLVSVEVVAIASESLTQSV